MARAIATLKARGTYEPNEHVKTEEYPPLTVAEHLEMIALGERIARLLPAPVAGRQSGQGRGELGADRRRDRDHGGRRAGGVPGMGGRPAPAPRGHRHRPGRRRVRRRDQAARRTPEPEGDEVRIQMPASSVIVTYTSQGERDRSLRLAEARQEIASGPVYTPPWAELADGDREMAALEARNWLRAAVRRGITAPGPAAAAEDTRRLDAIRGMLDRFDWEHDDRQLALEAIERIVDGGQPWSDHYHYEYATDRHDHRGDYADQRHDHDRDYAEQHHRHHDDKSRRAACARTWAPPRSASGHWRTTCAARLRKSASWIACGRRA